MQSTTIITLFFATSLFVLLGHHVRLEIRHRLQLDRKENIGKYLFLGNVFSVYARARRFPARVKGGSALRSCSELRFNRQYFFVAPKMLRPPEQQPRARLHQYNCHCRFS